MLERGVVVTYESVRNWCDRFGAVFACRARAMRPRTGMTWHLDDMFVRLRGEPYVLWRAVDEHGIELDVLLQKRRDTAAAKRFFERGGGGARTGCPGRSLLTSCAATRRQRQRSPPWPV